MKFRAVLPLVLTLILIAVVGCSRKESASGPATPSAPVAEGKPAPSFTLPDLSGKNVSLAEHRGKVVLVNFWATWCPPCREEIPSMVRLNTIMAGKPFQMLCISINEEGKKEVDSFLSTQKITLPVLLDPANQVARLYGITGVPETFIVDPKGVVVKHVVGGLDWSSKEVVDFLNSLMTR